MDQPDTERTEKEQISWFDELISELTERSEATLAELQAQNPEDIDVAERLPWLSRYVLDWLYEVRESLNPSSRAAIEGWHESERERVRRFLKGAELAHKRFQESLPPNWQDSDLEFPSLEILEDLQLSQGLPLAWVPPSPVLSKLLSASSLEERQMLIDNNATMILDSCDFELNRLSDPRLANWIASAREAVASMRSGYFRAGQALSAVALDSAISEFVSRSRRHAVVQSVNGKPTPPGTLPTSSPTWNDVDHPRALLVLYGLWGSHKQYWKKKGDEIPGTFSRHATVHSMSDRQYTRSNGLIAVMHLVGLLCLLDEMMEQQRGKLDLASS